MWRNHNNIYNDNKPVKENEHGYENIMIKRTSKRNDLKIKKICDNKNFHTNLFAKKK